MRGGQLFLALLRFARTAWTGCVAKSRIGAVRHVLENFRQVQLCYPSTREGPCDEESMPRRNIECCTCEGKHLSALRWHRMAARGPLPDEDLKGEHTACAGR